MRDWRPLGTERKERPEVGDVVGYAHAAWSIEHASEAEPTYDEERSISFYRPELRESKKPMRLTLQRLHGPEHERENDRRDMAVRFSPLAYRGADVYPEGRVPLCSCCNHPWPCIMITSGKEAQRQSADMDRKMNNAQPGCCYSCGEVISHRQKSIRYPEANLEIPGFPPPQFHLRNSCYEGRFMYENIRAKANLDSLPVDVEEPTRRLL